MNNTKKEREKVMSYYPKTVASQMEKGLTNELKQISEIGKVLRDLGNSPREVSYYLNVDEDFISDVLSCYNYVKPVSEMQLITPKRNTKWLEKGFLYEVVSKVDSFGYFKVKEPRSIGKRVRFIHKNNMKEVKVI